MRAVSLFFILIITYCNRFARSEQQSRGAESPTITKISKAKTAGQREYYIPSYSSPQLLQRQQEFIYPNNFRNAYQYSQNKYTNRVPDVVNQRKWWSSSGPLLANVNRNYRYVSPVVGDSSLDSTDNEYNSGSNNGFQYERPEKLNFRPNTNQNDDNNNNRFEKLKSESKSSDNSLKNKAKDFVDEQQSLTKAEDITIEQEFKDQENNDNKPNDMLLGPVMRRKSSHTSSLQRSDQRSLPLPLARQQSTDAQNDSSLGDVYFVAIVACVSAVAIFGVIGAGICVYKVQQSNKAAADVDYPAYGVVGPASKENNSGNISPNGDRKLAQSAQMYHYHHQKQQMIATEKAVTNRRNSASDVESDEENEEGEYTVYECPGLAPTGEMEVKNPLFHDDITPVSSPSVTGNNTKDK